MADPDSSQEADQPPESNSQGRRIPRVIVSGDEVPTSTRYSDDSQVFLEHALNQVGYQLVRLYACGGTSVVFEGIETGTERQVAIKHALKCAQDSHIIHEISILAKLNHPLIPKVLAHGMIADGRTFYVMPLYEGMSLSGVLREIQTNQDNLDTILAWFCQIAFVIGYAHTQGIVHRNLTVENIIILLDSLIILDWSLAIDLTRHDVNDVAARGEDFLSFVNRRQGRRIGTLGFMSPEQYHCKLVDMRFDVFALGAILHRILTNNSILRHLEPLEFYTGNINDQLVNVFTNLNQSGHNPELIAIAKKCLAPRAEDRPANGYEVAKLMADYLERYPPETPIPSNDRVEILPPPAI